MTSKLSDPRTDPTAAYAAFMGMGSAEWAGLLASLLKGGVLTPAEQEGFERAEEDRVEDYSHEAPDDGWSQTYLPSLPFPDDDDSWRGRAACLDSGLDFHSAAYKKRCLALCSVCPVTAECEGFAVRNRIEWGVYGGKPASVRKDERKVTPRPESVVGVDR